MSARPWMLLALLAPSGCDAFVGGACLPGYIEEGESCVAAPLAEGTGQGGEAGWKPGSGGSGSGEQGGAGQGGQGGTTTGPDCTPPLATCPDGCVDLQTDFDNCGACGVHCPTELCIDGACAGEPVGHMVTIGMSYAQSHASSRRVLGNAVFRTLHDPTRILEYREHAAPNTAAHLHSIIASEASQRNRAYLIDAGSAEALPDMLASSYYDVVLVHDQALAPAGALAGIGQALAPAIAQFASSGGTVVVTASEQGTGEMCELLGATGILSCSGFASAMGSLVHNEIPGDVVGNGVVAPFAPKNHTARILGAESASAAVAHVFADDDGEPIVVHKVVY